MQVKRTMTGIALICLLAVVGNRAAAQELVIVANSAVPDTSLTASQLKDMFLGRKKSWQGGSRVTLATLSLPDAKTAFLKEYIGKTTSQFDTYWKKMVFTGKAPLPKAFKTKAELLEFVSETEGAIGFISVATGETLAGCRKIEIR